MRRSLLVALVTACFTLGLASPALADDPLCIARALAGALISNSVPERLDDDPNPGDRTAPPQSPGVIARRSVQASKSGKNIRKYGKTKPRSSTLSRS